VRAKQVLVLEATGTGQGVDLLRAEARRLASGGKLPDDLVHRRRWTVKGRRACAHTVSDEQNTRQMRDEVVPHARNNRRHKILTRTILKFKFGKRIVDEGPTGGVGGRACRALSAPLVEDSGVVLARVEVVGPEGREAGKARRGEGGSVQPRVQGQTGRRCSRGSTVTLFLLAIRYEDTEVVAAGAGTRLEEAVTSGGRVALEIVVTVILFFDASTLIGDPCVVTVILFFDAGTLVGDPCGVMVALVKVSLVMFSFVDVKVVLLLLKGGPALARESVVLEEAVALLIGVRHVRQAGPGGAVRAVGASLGGHVEGHGVARRLQEVDVVGHRRGQVDHVCRGGLNAPVLAVGAELARLAVAAAFLEVEADALGHAELFQLDVGLGQRGSRVPLALVSTGVEL